MPRFVWALVLLAGCDGAEVSTKESGTSEGCGACAANGELCVVYADGDPGDWLETCEAMPADCSGETPCDVTECVVAMYDSCDDGYFGQANSCSGDSVIVTCSPDTVR